MDELDQDTEAGARYIPNSPTMIAAEAVIHRQIEISHGQPAAAFLASYGKLDEPISTILTLLRAALRQSSRQHLLTDQHVEQAPPAYRAAVADYFERLSRDYQTAPEPKSP